MKRNHGGPTGGFWGPLKSAAGTAIWESPWAWSPKTWGYKSHRPEGGSGLFHRGVGPLSREWRWPASRRQKVPSPAHFALAMRADAPARPSRQERARPRSGNRRELGGRRRAGVRPAASRGCAALQSTGPEGAPRWVAHAALSARSQRPGPAVRAPRTTRAPRSPRQPSGSCRPGDAPWPPPPRGRVGGATAAGGGGGGAGTASSRLSRLLPAPPGRTRVLGTGTPASERPCPGAAPRARRLAASRGSSRLTWCWPQP